jgi:hypothetical protein
MSFGQTRSYDGEQPVFPLPIRHNYPLVARTPYLGELFGLPCGVLNYK